MNGMVGGKAAWSVLWWSGKGQNDRMVNPALVSFSSFHIERIDFALGTI